MTLQKALSSLRHLAEISPNAHIHKQYPLNPPYPTYAIANVLHNLEREVLKMAGKPRKNNERWNATEFINRTLTEPEAIECKAWVKREGERIGDIIGQIMVDEYKVSCTWDDSNQCFIATFTGKEDQRFNSFKAMSSRSDDWFEALAINAFKHIVLMNGGVWSGEKQRNNWG